jgi:transposase
MPGPVRSDTAEFKVDAVALVRSSGKTVTETARDLGINVESLRDWVHQAAKAPGYF